jgi:hypothetical protein
MASGAARVQLAQELIRRHEERVLLKDATNDDHRMGPHNIDHERRAKFGEIV